MSMRLRRDHDDGSATMAAALSLAALVFTLLAALALGAGCSHNPATIMGGEQTRLGFGDYGSYNSVKGLLVTDVPRENSRLKIGIDEEHGIRYDPASGAITGIVSIEREIGPQITGYLVDLAKAAPQAALEYLRNARVIAAASTVEKPRENGEKPQEEEERQAEPTKIPPKADDDPDTPVESAGEAGGNPDGGEYAAAAIRAILDRLDALEDAFTAPAQEGGAE